MINITGVTGINGASDVISGSGVPVLGACGCDAYYCYTPTSLEIMVLAQCLKTPVRIDMQ